MDASQKDRSHLVIDVQSGEIGKAAVGDQLSGGCRREDRQVAAGKVDIVVGRAVQTGAVKAEVGEEQSLVALDHIACTFRLFGGGGDFLVVLQGHLAAAGQVEHFLACHTDGGRQQAECENQNMWFHLSVFLMWKNNA